MAVTETRNLPAQFIEDLGKDYAKQLAATTAIPVDTSKFAPQLLHKMHYKHKLQH